MGRDTQDIDAARRQVRDAARPAAEPDCPSTLSAGIVAPAAGSGAFAPGSAPEAPAGYELIREVHRGGQGVVYEALQRATKRRVALKFLHEGPFADARDRARFEREVEILGRLNHPNIVTIHDSGTHRGHFYYVMDLVNGRRLNEYVRDHRPAMRALLDLIATVCEAVGHAHERGIIHRDLKPANILVASGDGNAEPSKRRDAETGSSAAPQQSEIRNPKSAIPKILDFGLAKQVVDPLVSRVTGTGQILGTLPYMAPEQTVGDSAAIDARADIYALGVVLYQALTGHYPYPVTGDMMEVLRNIRDAQPIPPSQRWTAESGVTPRSRRGRSAVCPIDREVQTIVLKALAKEPERRYQTVGDLARDLRRYLKGEPIAARGDSFGYRFGKKLRRYRVHLGVAAALMVTIASAVYYRGEVRAKATLVASERAGRLVLEARAEAHVRPERALKLLEEAIRSNPDFLEAKVERAYLLKRQRHNPEAIQAAEAILQHDPENGRTNLLLAVLYENRDPIRASEYRARARQARSQDQYLHALALEPDQATQAVELLTSVLDANRLHFDARRERARRLFKLRQYQPMHEDTAILTEMDPNSADSWSLHGLALGGLNKPREAIDALGKSLGLAADYAPAYLNRANAYLNVRSFSEASQDAETALRLDPTFADAHAALARAYCGLQRFEEALLACDRAISLDPACGPAFQSRGHILSARREYGSALRAYESAIGIDGASPFVHYELAEVHRNLGRYGEAVKACTRAIERDPQMAVAFNLRGNCNAREGASNAALADFDSAIGLNESYVEARYNRIRLRWSMGDYKSAAEEAQIAVRLQPNRPEGRFIRGAALWFFGDTDGALADLSWVIEHDPTQAALLRLWIWEILALRGQEGKEGAASALAAAAQAQAKPWHRRIVGHCSGQLSPDELLGAAASGHERCEAYYYMGTKSLVQGDRSTALSHFRRCLETRELGTYELYAAEWHTRNLSAVGPADAASREAVSK